MKYSRIPSFLTKLLALALLITITACANKNSSESDDAAASTADQNTVQTQGVEDSDVNTVSNGDGQNLSGSDDMMDSGSSMMSEADLLKKRSFYFAYDSFRVSSEGKQAILAQGKYLAKTPVARVRIEGNTDERGTREYNLALGEKRAKAVRDLLLSAGAQSRQIEVITYGEERPKAMGSTEEAYRQNRRADIQYTVGQP